MKNHNIGYPEFVAKEVTKEDRKNYIITNCSYCGREIGQNSLCKLGFEGEYCSSECLSRAWFKEKNK